MQETPDFDPAALARSLLRRSRQGALATLMAQTGDPYCSLVNVASAPDASPILLISRLAVHTKNLLADPRVSLMLDERAPGDPLEGARIMLSGKAEEADGAAREVLRRRYLNAHPSAETFVDFKDFSFFRIRPSGAHLVAGFGRIVDLKPEHAYNYELAYVHDLSRALDAERADIKLTYYHHKTENVIERSGQLQFSNIEKQTLRGVEFQGRYDNGRFFTDLSVARNLKNEVCDQSVAAINDPTGKIKVPDCVQAGFVGGYLITMAVPELSANWTVGCSSASWSNTSDVTDHGFTVMRLGTPACYSRDASTRSILSR